MTKQKETRTALTRRRAVIIHGLDDAMLVASIAHELGVAIILYSAPNAVASLGPAWFRDIVDNLEQAYPALNFEAVLDCGDAAGYALAALRAGVKNIRFSGKRKTTGKIEDIAATYGARLLMRPARIFDPRWEQDPAAALRKWLGGVKTS